MTCGKLDQISQELLSKLGAGKISRQLYKSKFDKLYHELPNDVRRSVDVRKDRRTLGEFALNIYDSTRRERKLVDKWNNVNNCGLEIKSLGTDDSGLMIFTAANLSSKADYVVVEDDVEYAIEIKYCPVTTKLTYKVKDLRAYVEDKAFVITFMADTHWVLMNPELLERMLAEIPAKGHREMGGKPSIQILQRDFDKFIEVRSWKT